MSAKKNIYVFGNITTLWLLLRRTLIRSVILFSILLAFFPVHAQLNTDNAYAKPLKEVLADIEKKIWRTDQIPRLHGCQ